MRYNLCIFKNIEGIYCNNNTRVDYVSPRFCRTTTTTKNMIFYMISGQGGKKIQLNQLKFVNIAVEHSRYNIVYIIVYNKQRKKSFFEVREYI